MIAYEVLVQTIADWKAGVRPHAPTPPPARVGAPTQVEELSSGVVDLDEEFGSEPEPDQDEYEVAYDGYDSGPPDEQQ